MRRSSAAACSSISVMASLAAFRTSALVTEGSPKTFLNLATTLEPALTVLS